MEKKLSLKKLSDIANNVTKNLLMHKGNVTLKDAYDAHKAAYDAHSARNDVKPFSNAGYNRMKEHGLNVAHYARLMEPVK